MTRRLDKPTDMEYSDYMDRVQTNAEVVLENMDEYDDYDDIHEVIWETVDGDRLVTHYGWSLMTVLLSPQDPDDPLYCEPWNVYCDVTNDPSWGDVLSAMAYVCLYSDVYDKVQRLMEEDDE